MKIPIKSLIPKPVAFFLALLCSLPVFPQAPLFHESDSHRPTLLTFETKKGAVSVILPSILYSGGVISGTVEGKAKGEKEKEISENREILNGYSVSVLGKAFSVRGGTLTAEVPAGDSVTIDLRDEHGKVIETKTIPVIAKPAADQFSADEFSILPYVVAGAPAQITGPFDGSFSDSSLECNGQRLKLLAESGREIFFEAPAAATGSQNIDLAENKRDSTLRTNVLALKLGADKLNLMKGEQTSIHIEVTGLEGVEVPVPLTVVNQSPATVSLEGGDQQKLSIRPATDSPSGIFRKDMRVRAMVRGNFSLTVTIDPPGQNGPPESSRLLCDCRINGQSNLISPEACRQLGGHPYKSGEEKEAAQEEVPVEAGETVIRLRERKGPADTGTLSLGLASSGDLAAVRYSYKNVLDDNWTPIQTTDRAMSLQWPPEQLPAGFYVIRAQAADQRNTTSEAFYYTDIPSTPGEAPPGIVYNVSADAIERARHRARQLHDRIGDKEDELDGLEKQKQKAQEERDRRNELAGELEKIDDTLDRVPGTYRQKIKDLVDKIRQLKGELPTTDTALLKQAVDDAERRLKDCHDRLENLKNEQAELEKQRDKLRQQQDDLLDRMDKLHRDNGWTGGHGYHPDGRYWFGYVGNENANTGISDEAHEIQKQLRALRKPYLAALRRLEELPDEIDAAEKECARLNDELQKAMEAEKKGEEQAALQVSLDDLCRQIRSLLRPILQWCRRNPKECGFEDEIIKLMGKCPTDSSSWEHFWENFGHLIATKKHEEDQLRKEADNRQTEADHLQDKIDRAKDEIDRLREQERAENEHAEQLRRRRAKEQADAQKAREEQERRERERNKVKPQPYLAEPVDPSDDQLKFQAQIALKSLITDTLISEGCSCKTKALILAHGTNTIVSDIIGRIGVGVAFAPLEAFPGVGLGGHLVLGALKAIASSIYGGQKLSDELIKNLFDAVGGELFPKLVGDEFTGNRINSLAGKGLDDILEAEGVRTIQWEGSYDSRECGKLSGKTTLMVNPNTGWVVMMIKIPGCPLVVVKYRINDDGVAITNPIVKVIK